MKYKKLVDFLDEEFTKFRAKQNGWRTSQADFAREMGISQQALNKIMLGDTMPRLSTIITMAETVGSGIYDACNLPRLAPKGKDINYILDNFSGLNKDEQGKVLDVMQEMIERKQKGKVPDNANI